MLCYLSDSQNPWRGICVKKNGSIFISLQQGALIDWTDDILGVVSDWLSLGFWDKADSNHQTQPGEGYCTARCRYFGSGSFPLGRTISEAPRRVRLSRSKPNHSLTYPREHTKSTISMIRHCRRSFILLDRKAVAHHLGFDVGLELQVILSFNSSL